MSNNAFQVKGIGAEVKDIDTKQGIVSGYFASFDNIDSDGDIFEKGAFTKSIRENGPSSNEQRIFHLYQHDTNKPLGRPKELFEDSHGLGFTTKIADTSWGEDVIKLYEAGVINEHSVGFQTTRSNPDKAEGQDITVIKEVKLFEGSSVTWGANSETPTTGIKSLTKKDAIQRIQQLTKAVRGGTFRDETFHLLEIQLKQLEQFILDDISPDKDEAPSDEDTPIDITPKDLDDSFDEFIIKHLL